MISPDNEEEVTNILYQRYKSDDGGSTPNLLDAATKEERRRSSLRNLAPLQIDEVEKKWMYSSARCDLHALKTLYAKNLTLINFQDFVTGFAAIHWAAKKGRIDIVTWLCQNNADINIRTHGGYTGLHLASMHDKSDLVNKLIADFKADTNVRDYSGRKAINYLVKRGQDTQPLRIPDYNLDPKYHVTPRSPAVARRTLPHIARTLPNSASMPAIADEEIRQKKKKNRLSSISSSFKSRKKIIVVKRNNGEQINGDDDSPPAFKKKDRWKKSLSVPDINIVSAPATVIFEEDF